MDELKFEKLFYGRFEALHYDPILVSVFAKFGYEPFRRSSVLEGFAKFVSNERFWGDRCVEIGSWKGLTALVLARGFDEVVSIDITDDPQRKEIAEAMGVKNVRFVTVKNNTEKAKLIRSLKFDAAYVDGDHIRDTVTDFALVRDCGHVLFHEYWEAQPAVWGLVNALKKSGKVITEGKLALWRKDG